MNSNSYWAAGGDLEQQAGTKEKGLEDEIELVWEKGGSGLNFYTDVQVSLEIMIRKINLRVSLQLTFIKLIQRGYSTKG